MASKQYLQSLTLPSEGQEIDFLTKQRRACYSTSYPFKLFPDKRLHSLEFSPITIFYGGNGSGKTTLLNVIAEHLMLQRHTHFNSSAFFPDYVSMCRSRHAGIPRGSRVLTSDDVTDYLLHLRELNSGIDARRSELLAEYTDRKYKDLRFTSLSDYDTWKEGYDAKTKSGSRFVKDRLMQNVDLYSNGETALRYYTDRITLGALYLVDEPENSLSALLQQTLAEFIADSARFYGCQFVIATHSPFFLAIPEARIYDLDAVPVKESAWTQLENVRAYYEFFKKHQREFA